MERENWNTIQAILICRTYRRALDAFEGNKPTSEQSELLTQVDIWRDEEDG